MTELVIGKNKPNFKLFYCGHIVGALIFQAVADLIVRQGPALTL